MKQNLPQGLVKYAETPEFTEKTVPDKLTAEHDTKPGVWGKLIVKKGALDYIVPGPPLMRARIESGDFGVIAPQVKHRVKITEPVVFQVEFYKAASQD